MIKAIIKFFQRIRRRWFLAKQAKALQPVVDQMIADRKALRSDINKFLRKYFGVDARSKYIPADFKNKEEVKLAILDKFSPRMEDLNVTYEQLFK
tara:strand:+ start:305 stop:589 length:285 start_codon:yes stop_codon:yes gene_type:complete